MNDLISKEVAIDTLKAVRDLVWDVDIPSPTVPEYIEHHEQMQSIMRNIDILTDKIIKMPSAQPEWIPCSERMPENNDPVNVTWVNHNPEVYYADIKDKPFTATAHYHHGRWYWFSSVTQDYLNEYDVWTPDLVDKDVEIIAWMPLPEPYKEDQEGEE